jgi:hypothetical protein
MSTDQVKKFAKQFIDDQKQILEAHGDSAVRSKYNDAIAGAQRTFETLCAASEKLRAAQKA